MSTSNRPQHRLPGPLAGALWRKACEFDGFRPDSAFVTFSSGNRYSAAYRMLQLAPADSPRLPRVSSWEARRQREGPTEADLAPALARSWSAG